MRNFVQYVNFDYRGGQNDTDTADQLAENEAVRIYNAYIRKKGKLEKRSGQSLTGNDIGADPIINGFGWKQDNGTKWNFQYTKGVLYYLNGTTWTALDNAFTASATTMCFIAAKNKVYMCNGVDNIHSFNGSSTTLNSCLTDLGSSIPKSKQLIWWKNYMFSLVDVDLGGTVYPQRVYFSNLNDPDTWTTANDYFDVNKSDGQPITGGGILEKFLVLFKEKSSFVMTGSVPSEWRIDGTNNNLQSVENGIGAVNWQSILQVGNDLWFMSTQGIRTVRRNENGTTPLTGLVSGDIQTTLDGINETQIAKTAAVLFDNRVYFAIPTGTSTYNDLVVVADTTIVKEKPFNPHPWVVYTGWNVSCWWIHASSTAPELYSGHSNDGKVLKCETGSSDNSAAIDFDYISPMVNLRSPDTKKTARFMYVSGESGGDYDVNVYSSTNGNNYDLLGQLNLSSGVVWNSGVWGTSVWGYSTMVKDKFTLGKAGYQIQVRFRNNEASQPVTIYQWTMAIKPKQFK